MARVGVSRGGLVGVACSTHTWPPPGIQLSPLPSDLFWSFYHGPLLATAVLRKAGESVWRCYKIPKVTTQFKKERIQFTHSSRGSEQAPASTPFLEGDGWRASVAGDHRRNKTHLLIRREKDQEGIGTPCFLCADSSNQRASTEPQFVRPQHPLNIAT